MSTLTPLLDTRLRRLRLGYMAQAFEAQNTDSLTNNHSYLEFLEALVDLSAYTGRWGDRGPGVQGPPVCPHRQG